MLTTFDLDEYVFGALRAGAAGFLLKGAPRKRLVEAIRVVLDYLIARRVGEAARMSVLAEVGRGAYQLQPFAAGDVEQARAIIERQAAFRVLTVDGEPFRLLPRDA